MTSPCAAADTASTVAMLNRIPYVVSAIIAGSMAEAGTFGVFCVVIELSLLVVTLCMAGWQGVS